MKDLEDLNTGQKFFLRHQGANFKNDREKHDFYRGSSLLFHQLFLRVNELFK